MNNIYLITYILSIIISSIFTAIFINRKAIATRIMEFKSKRSLAREERLKSLVKQYVIEYLNELKNGTAND